MTGLSVAVVARIEMRGGTPQEVEGYRKALEIALGQVVESAGRDEPESEESKPAEGVTKSPAVTGFLGGKHNAVRTTEWNGLRRGDLVRVVGEKGQFRFMYHHRDDKQGEYVEVAGPMVRYRGQLLAEQERSLRVDRIIMPHRRR
jgi:hypothetical protein